MLEGFPGVTAEQVRFFQENGYLQIHNLLTPEEVKTVKATMLKAIEKHREHHLSIAEGIAAGLGNPAAANESAEDIEEQNRQAARLYQKVFDQRVNLWKIDEAMAAITRHPKLAEIARRLGGFASVRLWHDQALIKPGGDSLPSNWHQDTVYWPMDRDGGLSIWIALDDVDDQNGCMWFIPKSRDLGHLRTQNLTQNDPEAMLKLPEVQGKLNERVCMAMQAGGATFHDGLTLHYANANRTDRPRHAFVVIYMPGDVAFNGAAHICTDDKGFKVGDPIAGDDFPILAAEADAAAVQS